MAAEGAEKEGYRAQIKIPPLGFPPQLNAPGTRRDTKRELHPQGRQGARTRSDPGAQRRDALLGYGDRARD